MGSLKEEHITDDDKSEGSSPSSLKNFFLSEEGLLKGLRGSVTGKHIRLMIWKYGFDPHLLNKSNSFCSLIEVWEIGGYNSVGRMP